MRMSDLPRRRLFSQRVLGSTLRSPGAVARWMVALQAQDSIMARWAVGVRLPGSTDRSVLAAIDRGQLIRTHLLRPTWHLAAAGDVRWLLALSAPQIKARAASRDRQLELTEAVFTHSNRLMERAVRDGADLTREEIVQRLRDARIPVDENRASHLLMRAELEGILCSGASRRGALTYAKFDDRVPASAPIPREEALSALASRYFAGRGPASVEDFTWWSGLSARDARRAVESVRASLDVVESDGSPLFEAAVRAAGKASNGRGGGVHLLPAYDEFVISYADRKAILARVHVKKAISDNGIFHPTILADGQVIGVWTRRKLGADSAMVEACLFGRPSAAARAGISRCVRRLAEFWGMETTLEYRAEADRG